MKKPHLLAVSVRTYFHNSDSVYLVALFAVYEPLLSFVFLDAGFVCCLEENTPLHVYFICGMQCLPMVDHWPLQISFSLPCLSTFAAFVSTTVVYAYLLYPDSISLLATNQITAARSVY